MLRLHALARAREQHSTLSHPAIRHAQRAAIATMLHALTCILLLVAFATAHARLVGTGAASARAQEDARWWWDDAVKRSNALGDIVTGGGELSTRSNGLLNVDAMNALLTGSEASHSESTHMRDSLLEQASKLGLLKKEGAPVFARPVAFVTGLMGGRLMESVNNRERTTNPFCRRNVDTELVWPPPPNMTILWHFTCLCANLQLVYDEGSGTYRPKVSGVNVSVDESFGGAIDLAWKDWVNALESVNPAFVRGRDIVGLPYDWRLGPDAWSAPDGDFDRTKAAIEAAVAANDGRKIVVVSISMGGPYFAAFASRHVSQQWRDKHIHAFLSLSGVFSGSSLAILHLLTGAFGQTPLPSYLLKPFMEMSRSLGSIPWLVPTAPTFSADEAIVTVKDKTYKLDDMGSLFRDAGATQAALLWSKYKDVSGLSLAPNVTTICVSGYNHSTLATLTFSSMKELKTPSGATFVDGDGTVASSSLRVCDSFAGVQRMPVYPVHVLNATHSGLLGDKDMGKILFPLVFQQQDVNVGQW